MAARTNSTDMDGRDVKRGLCSLCSDCSGYQRDLGKDHSKCLICSCPPGKHKKVVTDGKNNQHHSLQLPLPRKDDTLNDNDFLLPKCQLCKKQCYFDMNARVEYPYCQFHLSHTGNQDYSDVSGSISAAASINTSQSAVAQSSTSLGTNGKDPSLCAIEDCNKPRHIDETGKIHDCCGYTHAMELLRRKAIERMQQPVVKGVTHCLLPNCSKVTWPFMNYCCRTHAEKGKALGLLPPIQDVSSDASTAASKDPSLCGLPGCNKPRCRNSNDGSLYDFCGRTHALEADKRGIKVAPAGNSGPKLDSMCRLDECRKPKRKSPDGTMFDYCCKDHADKAASNASSVTKDENMCIIPECSRPKYMDPQTNTRSDYCSKSHVQEGQKRGIQPILKSRADVDAYLKGFSSILTVVDIKENDHAKPGGALYKKFVAARDSLPAADRKTCLAFHGTAETNIDSICTNGYDPSRRRGQSYGAGEYFATSPSTPLGYVSGGKKILLNELLLGQNGVHHTKHGDIVVMKYPEHDLPRFVITFK